MDTKKVTGRSRIKDSDIEQSENGAAPAKGKQTVQITAPNLKRMQIPIIGTAPYVQNKFSQRARDAMRSKMTEGPQANKGRKREPKDFDAEFQGAMHISDEGWHGIPASAFRNGMIDACRLVGFKMTHAKMAVFVVPDGLDQDDGQPLVKIRTGDPQKIELAVRNESGVADIRARPMWRKWTATLVVEFDADFFKEQDIANLVLRLGHQVGIGAGRPFSKESAGLGWGLFTIQKED